MDEIQLKMDGPFSHNKTDFKMQFAESRPYRLSIAGSNVNEMEFWTSKKRK